MDYSTLRILVRRADKEAMITRGWELYQDRVEKGEMGLMFRLPVDRENFASRAWEASRPIFGRSGPADFSLKTKYCCALRRAREKAKLKYEDRELSHNEIRESIYTLSVNLAGKQIAKALKPSLPRGDLSGIKKTLKEKSK